MKSKIYLFTLIVSISFLSSSCQWFSGDKKSGVFTGQYKAMDSSLEKILIPRSLFKKIEELYIQHYKEKNPNSPFNRDQVAVQIPRKYLKFYVDFENSLLDNSRENVRMESNDGGGLIDLKDVLKKKGSYKVYFKFPDLEEDQVKDIEVYFISHSRQRKLDSKTKKSKSKKMGMGCEKYVKVTKWFQKNIFNKGMDVRTKNLQYISALGGIYAFFLIHEEELSLAIVQFTDSRFARAFCD